MVDHWHASADVLTLGALPFESAFLGGEGAGLEGIVSFVMCASNSDKSMITGDQSS